MYMFQNTMNKHNVLYSALKPKYPLNFHFSTQPHYTHILPIPSHPIPRNLFPPQIILSSLPLQTPQQKEDPIPHSPQTNSAIPAEKCCMAPKPLILSSSSCQNSAHAPSRTETKTQSQIIRSIATTSRSEKKNHTGLPPADLLAAALKFYTHTHICMFFC